MNKSLSVLVTGRDKKELTALEHILQEQTDFDVKIKLASNGHFDPLHDTHVLPDLAIICLSEAWEAELQKLSERPSSNRFPIIVISNPGNEMEVMRHAMRAGARDCFTRT